MVTSATVVWCGDDDGEWVSRTTMMMATTTNKMKARANQSTSDWEHLLDARHRAAERVLGGSARDQTYRTPLVRCSHPYHRSCHVCLLLQRHELIHRAELLGLKECARRCGFPEFASQAPTKRQCRLVARLRLVQSGRQVVQQSEFGNRISSGSVGVQTESSHKPLELSNPTAVHFL